MRSKMGLAAILIAAAMTVAAACGGGEDPDLPSSGGPESSPVASGGSVAPNVFMTFEGRRYRAVDVGTDLVAREDLEVAGTTEEIDTDHTGRVEVFRLTTGSDGSLYTFQPSAPMPEAEGGSLPDVWLEWAPAEGTPLPPDEPVSSTPSPDDGGPPGEPAGVEPAPVAAARAHLADRLGVGIETIQVVSVEAVDWPNACLGAAGPGEACAEVITSGYRVVMAAGGAEYEYHTDSGAYVRPAR